MAASHMEPTTKLVNLERELVCFICTEVLYQPLSILDCLHPFCGACLKEWFSHQYRKATSSRSSSSSSNPYTCPTCRAPVKDVQPNAMINTFLDMFLEANPDRARSAEEKQEMAQNYKPGEKIMPKVEGRRRERRSRRDHDGVDAQERRLIEEVQELSLRELRDGPSASQNSLQPPAPSGRDQESRSRDREERRQRRRDQGRQEQQQRPGNTETGGTQFGSSQVGQSAHNDVSSPAPISSPRHPEAVEERQRQQTVVHRASLASLISSSDNGLGCGSGDGDHVAETQIMEEIQILAERLGLLDGIDIDAMTEIEQDALAERIAEAYRRRERNHRNNPSMGAIASTTPVSSRQFSNSLQVDDARRHQRTESGSRQRRADTMPPGSRNNSVGAHTQPPRAETQPLNSSQSVPPQSTVILSHRRRASSQGQRSGTSRNRSRQSSSERTSGDARSSSTHGAAYTSRLQDPNSVNEETSSNYAHRQGLGSPRSETQHPAHRETPRSSGPLNSGIASSTSQVAPSDTSPTQHLAELDNPNMGSSGVTVQNTSQSTTRVHRRASGLFDEPSISCFRCHRADLQYQVYKHCDKCDLDLCLRCYRTGRGCKHWYGFGRAAMSQFESSGLASFEQMELPHLLTIGRQYKRPEDHTIIRSKLAKDGLTVIPLQTSSDPATRLQEGRFCDRCHNFANSCFWSCDWCNYGEWGFCRDCVNTHHCCTHPLLPSAHKLYAPPTSTTKPLSEGINLNTGESSNPTLRPSPVPSQPSSATSLISTGAGPIPDFVNLVIVTSCDVCAQPIPPSSHRFHCPSHPSPTQTNAAAQGDYDICTPCYQNLVKTNRIKREDGTAGWRKCPSGHRMIVTTFHADNEGGQRRIVINDLVGGWKTTEEAMELWNLELEARRQTTGDETSLSPHGGVLDGPTVRRLARLRTDSYPQDQSFSMIASLYHSNNRFPPDGGTGLRGTTLYSYYPDDTDKGPLDLMIPSCASITEIKIHDEYPDWCGAVYAGDRGLIPAGYVRI